MTETIPTHEELVSRAEAVAEKVARFELESDQRRSLHPESVAAMREAGLFKVIQPRRIGGYEQGLPTLQAVSRALGAGCTAASWVYTVTGAHTWVMGMYPEEVQDEIYEDDPDTLIPGTLAAQGKATPVDGGFRISGQWQFASGCDHARWGLFCARQTDSEKGAPKHIHVMVPASDYRIEDTWHVMGLRGTGSKDVVMDDAFVPAHRAMATGDLFDAATPAASRHATGVYRFPILPSLTYLLTGPVLAITDRIYEAHVERTAGRRDRYDGSSKAGKQATQIRVAESWAEIRSAKAFVREIEKDYRGWLARDERPSDEERISVKWRAAYAVRLCTRAADRLFEASGANTVYEREPILRLVESLHTAAHHAAADFDNNATSFGSFALGQGPGTFLI
jgi:alkylation response protein AidB-like acyl-CoA dehydrogenase